jgi:dCTP deaminase
MLSGEKIVEELCRHESGLAITPLLDVDEQVGNASVDLRLGPDLIVMRRTTGAMAFDPAHDADFIARTRAAQQYIRRPFGSAAYLHPGEFVIARTLEHVTLPEDISGEAVGRSSLGRLGLVIATATLIQPEFQGTITLELVNLASVPIVLYVGMRIAQIALYRVERGQEQ